VTKHATSSGSYTVKRGAEGDIWTADYQNALDDYCIQLLHCHSTGIREGPRPCPQAVE
jgi:hypothetical protein